MTVDPNHDENDITKPHTDESLTTIYRVIFS